MFATVLLDKGIDKPLEYKIPQNLIEKVRMGSRVLVPLRSREVKGTVLLKHGDELFPDPHSIQDVLVEESHISQDLFDLATWISKYYATPLRKVLLTMVPSTMRKEMKPPTEKWILPGVSLVKLKEYLELHRHKYAKQCEVIDHILEMPKGINQKDLLAKPHISRASIQSLVKKGILSEKEMEIDFFPFSEEEFLNPGKKTLNDEQRQAYQSVIESLEKDSFATHLIHGITGSGKTEIYLQAMDHARNLGKDVILLVPEIALTSQTIERIKSRFSEKIAILHHRLSDRERFSSWQKMQSGEIHIVIGARSAIFSPMPNVGLIIIDEEQETAYKQTEEMPCYHARDIAIIRAKFANATVVLGSATPSLESYNNALNGKYQLHKLTKRAGHAEDPTITIINMQSEHEKANSSLFSNPLLQGIKSRIEKGEQTLLFLNRRGFFSCQKCEACDEVIKCKHCDLTLTYHKEENILSCHLCGYTLSPVPTICPACHAENAFKYRGPGTEQVQRALHKIFPDIRTLRMDRDTTKKKKSHDLIFKEFRSGKADVLIGTQMIAKGLHFPSVTLVGVIYADSGLMIPDFRAQESCYQLLTQVAGRSGRGHLPGEVIFQTSHPDHLVIQSAAHGNYHDFFTAEMGNRELFSFPPFVQVVKILFSGFNEKRTEKEIDAFYRSCIRQIPGQFTLYPPSPCGYTRVKGKYRFQFLIKGPRGIALSAILARIYQDSKKVNGINILIDIDPISTFS